MNHKRNPIARIISKLLFILLGTIAALSLLEAGARLLGPPFEPSSADMHGCDRLVGWRGKPNFQIRQDWYGYDHQIHFNSRGMHDGEHNLNKADNVFRVLLLGDSFIEAAHVEEHQTSHTILEQKLNELSGAKVEFEVINAGILAWGPGQELMYFRSEGIGYRPDLIIAMWVPANDLRNVLPVHAFTADGINCYAPYFAICNGRFDPEPWFFTPGIPPAQQTCPVVQKRASTFLSQIYPHSRLYQRLAPLFNHKQLSYKHDFAPWLATESSDEILSYAYQLTTNIYAQLATEAKTIGAKTVTTIVPFNQAVYSTAYPDYQAALRQQIPGLDGAIPTLPNQRFMEAMTTQNIPVFDMHPHFVKHLQTSDEDLHWPEDFHWNIPGNRVVGELLANWLITEGLVPTNSGTALQ